MLAQRADQIQHAFAFLQIAEQLSRCADNHKDDVDGSFFTVKVCDRKRHAFAVFVGTHYDKLAGQCLAGDERSLQRKLQNIFLQRLTL